MEPEIFTSSCFLALTKLFLCNPKDRYRLQHFITEKFATINRNEVLKQFTLPSGVAWLENLRNFEAGSWLNISPKTTMHSLSSPQFEVALNLRLFRPQKNILSGLKCNCSKIKTIMVDKEGLHFCSGCSFDGVRINTHDRIRDQISTIMRYSGSFTRQEQSTVFRG